MQSIVTKGNVLIVKAWDIMQPIALHIKGSLEIPKPYVPDDYMMVKFKVLCGSKVLKMPSKLFFYLTVGLEPQLCH